jgi:hypothetical protein
VFAQSPPTSSSPAQNKLSKEKLEQIVAPIALYPDALLAQVLMASTYPLEIVQAARWSAANPSLKGKTLEDALQKQTWDPSVKSIVAVPSVLKMMNEKLEWTQMLGDAFLAQKNDVMTAVQTLRLRADQAGTLKSSKEQKVAKSTVGTTTYIVIEPQSPSVVYVPVYNPTIVYGTWAYPAFPPYYYYPPGYVAGNAFWFGAGVAVGSALWGHCNWGRNDININVSHYNQFNRTSISHTTWRHDAVHRHGVPYSNPDVAREFRQNHRDHASRETLRGHEVGAKPSVTPPKTRELERTPKSGPSDSKRDTAGQIRESHKSAFDSSGSGLEARADSLRGKTSRTSSQQRPASRPAGGPGPGSRPGGRGG